jgi:hypothetical protein
VIDRPPALSGCLLAVSLLAACTTSGVGSGGAPDDAMSAGPVDAGGADAGGVDAVEGDSAPSPDAAVNMADASVTDSGEAGVGTGCSASGAICWGFEEGMTTPPGWSVGRTDYGATVLANASMAGAGPALVVDETRPHWGRYSLHARSFVGGAPGTQGGPKATIVYTLPADFGPVLWGRAFVYTDPAAPDSHAGIFNARYPRPGSSDTSMSAMDWYEVASYTQKYMTVWHPPEPPGYPEDVQVSDKPVELDRFACLEWLFDGSNGDAGEGAQPRTWVDGAELSWPDSFTYPDGSASPFREPVSRFVELETGVYLYQGLTTATDWWIDDLAVSPQRIGCDP